MSIIIKLLLFISLILLLVDESFNLKSKAICIFSTISVVINLIYLGYITIINFDKGIYTLIFIFVIIMLIKKITDIIYKID